MVSYVKCGMLSVKGVVDVEHLGAMSRVESVMFGSHLSPRFRAAEVC